MCFGQCGSKTKKHGRPSGGVLVMIRKSIQQYFKNVKRAFNFGLIFTVSAKLTGSPFFIIFSYIPPFGSKAYDDNENNGIYIIEEEISYLQATYPDHKILLTGDFNARTKDVPDYILDDSTNNVPLSDIYEEDNFKSKRKSKDLHGEINNHGKSLLSLCCTLNIHFLNGRVSGDYGGHVSPLMDPVLLTTQ